MLGKDLLCQVATISESPQQTAAITRVPGTDSRRDSTRLTHDAQCIIYAGPDTAYTGREICFAYNEDTLTIVDVTDKSAPVQISRTGYNNRQYTHQGWVTDDHAWLLMDDELDESRDSDNK